MAFVEFTQRDTALRAVGRTVVNFQRLEHNLKLAARLGPVHGTLAKIKRDVEKRIERAATLTLGQAIQAWLSAAQDGPPPETSPTPDLFDVTMSMSFSWGADSASQIAHGLALKSLLETRNSLIHGGLVEFQWDSPTECEGLIERLEQVNASIATELEFVTSFLRAVASIRPEDLDEAERQLAQETQSAGDA
jgi:hypothetical protein